MTSAATDRASLAPYPTYPLQHILSETARRLPQKAAIIDGEYVYSYQQLDVYSNRFAAALAKLGVVKGDRVGLLAPNCAEFEIAFFGIVKAGAVVTTINSGYREREIAHQLSNSGAEVLVVHESLHQMAEAAHDGAPEVKRMIIIESSSRESDSFWGLIERSPATTPPVRINAKEDLAALPYSSGTTGLSKGVMLTHFNMTANLRQFMVRPGEALQQRESDVMLAHLPLFHIYGMQVLMNAVILSGGTQVMMGRFDMGEMLRLVATHKITHLYTVPPVGIGLSMLPNLGLEPDFSSMIAACLAAAPASAELQMRVQEVVGFPVFQAYGMTELSPVSNLDYIEPDRMTPGSVGPAISDTEERVVDTETGTKDVPVGELGELLVRGPQVMKGYYANEEATRETIDDDGWLHTGDIVRMNEDGCVWIVDRVKELIKYKGFQVPPAELEGLLLEHPAITDAAVVAKPDVESGEVPKAFVVTKQGEDVSGEDVMSFVASKVATFKHIREVEFIDAIPKNPSGKILRRMLIEGEGE